MILLTKKWQESKDWGKTCGTCERFVRDYPLSPGGTCEIPKRKRKSHKRKKNKSQDFDGPKRVYQTRKACSHYKEMEDLMLTKKDVILKILPEIKLDTNGYPLVCSYLCGMGGDCSLFYTCHECWDTVAPEYMQNMVKASEK